MSAIKSLKTYLVGSVAELKKVTWPTKQQTINYSILVIIMSLGVAIFFAFLDYIFSKGITSIL
jgi:preprotein translocase subunit SecE